MGLRIASVSGLRGLVGDGLDPMVVTEFAAAYASGCEAGPILVGNDGRVSAAVFEHAVIAGVAATGHDVLRAGTLATPTLGLLVREREASGAVQISASHNPPEYNGLKLFQREGIVLSPEQGAEVLRRIEERDYRWATVDRLGTVGPLPDPELEHRSRVLGIVDVDAIRARRFRVVLDGCHGGGARLGARLLRELGCELITLGASPDGHYEHAPEPTEENLRAIPAVITAVGADVGFVQDPDADRLAIIDEKGRYIGEERTLVLSVLRRLADTPGTVVANLSTSRMIDDVARAAGSTVIRTPVGEYHVVQAMREARAVLGGEGNGGVIDPRVGFVRDSFVAMALTLDLLVVGETPLSTLLAGLPAYAMVKCKFATARPPSRHDIQRLREAYPDARADERDGLRLDWDDRWVHVRGSNTEPLLRVIAEARDARQAQELAHDVGRLVTGS
jgi:phosphomannomutase